MLHVAKENEDLLQIERAWIILLQTAFPCGLNDNIFGFGSISSGILPTQKGVNPYYGMHVPRVKSKRNTKKRRSKKFNDEFQHIISTAQLDSLVNVKAFLGTLYIQSRKTLLHTYTQTQASDISNINKSLFFGYINHRSFIKINAIKPPKIYTVFKFPGRGLETINFCRLINNTRAKRLLFSDNCVGNVNKTRPLIMVNFKYGKPISRILTNHVNTVMTINKKYLLN